MELALVICFTYGNVHVSMLFFHIISHWSECPSSKSLQTINAGEGVEKRESFYTVGGNAN